MPNQRINIASMGVDEWTVETDSTNTPDTKHNCESFPSLEDAIEQAREWAGEMVLLGHEVTIQPMEL